MKSSIQNKISISIIIPAYNCEISLAKCLQSLKQSSYPIHETIVVDDYSTDNTVRVAESYGVTVIESTENKNANSRRNEGALLASGEILLFIDSDVLVQPDTIKNIVDIFNSKELDAVVGLYAVPNRQSNLATKYKNIWIRYSYLKTKLTVDWIFGAVSAIKREAFIALEGFNIKLHSQHGIDDIELGKRMSKLNYKIELNPSVVVEHLKEFQLIGLLKNDFNRSYWFVKLAASNNQLKDAPTKGFVNIYPTFIYSTILVWPLIITFLLSFVYYPVAILFSILVITYHRLNFRFLKYFKKHYNLLNAVGVFFIIFWDHVSCSLGVIKGLLAWTLNKFFLK